MGTTAIKTSGLISDSLYLSFCSCRTALTILIFIARAFISAGFQVVFVYTPEVGLHAIFNIQIKKMFFDNLNWTKSSLLAFTRFSLRKAEPWRWELPVRWPGWVPWLPPLWHRFVEVTISVGTFQRNSWKIKKGKGESNCPIGTVSNSFKIVLRAWWFMKSVHCSCNHFHPYTVNVF